MTDFPRPPWCPPPWFCPPPWYPPPWWCSPPMSAPSSSDKTKTESKQAAVAQTSMEDEVKNDEKASSTANDVSREEKNEEDEDTIGEASYIILSDSEADDSVQDPESSGAGNGGNGGKEQDGDESAPSLDCTVCKTQMFSALEVHEHPTLHGLGLCSKCFDFLFNTRSTKDKEDGTEEQCRWCGEGGDIVLCDTCDKVFCQNCIIRNYGCRRGLSPILSSSKWSCFCCNPQPLRVHVDRMKAFLRSVPPGINSSVRQENAGIFVTRGQFIGDRGRSRVKSRDAGRRASDLNPGIKGGAPTIAE